MKTLRRESVSTGFNTNYKSYVLKTGSHTFIILLCFFFNHAVFSRKCYQCTSEFSLKDCEDHQVRVECLTSNECVIGSGNSTFEKFYVKGCAAICSASEVPGCQDPGVDCKVQCCSSNYCNGTPGGMVSGLLLMACVSTGFIYLSSYLVAF